MKIHLRQHNKDILISYAQSPHIVNMFKAKELSICFAGTKLTDNINEVTCNRCLNIYENKKPEDLRV